LSFATAGNVQTEVLSSPYSQCIPTQSKDVNYYIPNTSVTFQPYDDFWLKNPAVLVASKTKV
jgi:hypothetical protein